MVISTCYLLLVIDILLCISWFIMSAIGFYHQDMKTCCNPRNGLRGGKPRCLRVRWYLFGLITCTYSLVCLRRTFYITICLAFKELHAVTL